MKIRTQFTIYFAICLIPALAFCQAVSPTPAASPIASSAIAPSWLVSLAVSHPWILSVLAVVGMLRLLLKPLFAGLHTFFEGAGLTSYDAEETAIEQSKAMSVLFFVLDYLGSIKVPVAAAPAVTAGTPTTPAA